MVFHEVVKAWRRRIIHFGIDTATFYNPTKPTGGRGDVKLPTVANPVNQLSIGWYTDKMKYKIIAILMLNPFHSFSMLQVCFNILRSIFSLILFGAYVFWG